MAGEIGENENQVPAVIFFSSVASTIIAFFCSLGFSASWAFGWSLFAEKVMPLVLRVLY